MKLKRLPSLLLRLLSPPAAKPCCGNPRLLTRLHRRAAGLVTDSTNATYQLYPVGTTLQLRKLDSVNKTALECGR